MNHCKKVKFLTLATANNNLEAMLQDPTVRKIDKRFLNVYLCDCGFYHLGKSTAVRRKSP